MRIRDGKQKAWDACLAANADSAYGRAVNAYAKRWADAMEREIAAMAESGMCRDPREAVALCADEASHEADTDGITGFMHGCAVAALADVWEHGDALAEWHNASLGHGSGGVANPALIVIGTAGD